MLFYKLEDKLSIGRNAANKKKEIELSLEQLETLITLERSDQNVEINNCEIHIGQTVKVASEFKITVGEEVKIKITPGKYTDIKKLKYKIFTQTLPKRTFLLN